MSKKLLTWEYGKDWQGKRCHIARRGRYEARIYAFGGLYHLENGPSVLGCLVVGGLSRMLPQKTLAEAKRFAERQAEYWALSMWTEARRWPEPAATD